MTPRSHVQPALVNDWGVTFHGRAETITGEFWWYELDGKRYPLRPVFALAEKWTA